MSLHQPGDKALHLLALGSRRFRKFCFARECERNDFAFDRQRRNIFLCALPRSGSTALLNALFESGEFASTTYALMPFVLAPTLARRLSKIPRRVVRAQERAHRDGIPVSLESAEALDGLFWSTVFPVGADRLLPREVPPRVLRSYAMFIENLLTGAGAARYLSKMNQGIDKLASLAAYFDHSTFVLPFRQPLQQASSLLRQDRHFSALSWYEKKYFAWLGHHEFGATHREFFATADPVTPRYDRVSLNYWLAQWLRAYRYLSSLADSHPNLLPVSYEQLSAGRWASLARRLNTSASGDCFEDRNDPSLRPGDGIDDSLYRSCIATYRRLSAQSTARLCRQD